jgi:hypothetical protein
MNKTKLEIQISPKTENDLDDEEFGKYQLTANIQIM